MASQNGPSPSPLSQLLEGMQSEAYRYDFYQALRLLEKQLPNQAQFGKSKRLRDEPVRLIQKPTLRFAPAALSECKPKQQAEIWELAVEFFGMFGPNGPLPLHLTEYARDRIHQEKDPTFAAFVNVFHHRLLTLFYRAWADAQPTVHFDRPDQDRYAQYVGSFVGIGFFSLLENDSLPDSAKWYYGGLMSAHSRHAEGLRQIVSEFFEVPAQIEEFIGQWVEIPEGYRFKLGEDPDSATLGVSCTLGSHAWDCQQKFRLRIGPLTREQFERLLPGSPSHERMLDLIRNYVGDSLQFEIQWILRRDETPSWVLGENRLGLSMWLEADALVADADDLCLLAEPVVQRGS